jgi:dienelactone hydrolase
LFQSTSFCLSFFFFFLLYFVTTIIMRFEPILVYGSLVLCVSAASAQSLGGDNSSNTLVNSLLGPYPVTINEHEIKTTRQDPLADSPELRRLLVIVYRPHLDNFTCPDEHQTYIPYGPPVVNAAMLDSLAIYGNYTVNGQITNRSTKAEPFDQTRLFNCSRPFEPLTPSAPIVVFSPGSKGVHNFYTGLLQSVASSGYTVVAIDHTYESVAQVFPDGTVALQSKKAQAYYDVTQPGGPDPGGLQSVRSDDMTDVLDAIEDGEVPGLGSFSKMDSNSTTTSNANRSHPTAKPLRVAAYGHSLGGSTAQNALVFDSRVVGAINIDGPVFGPATNVSTSKPFLILGSEELSPTVLASQLSGIYNSYTGWKAWAWVKNSVHYGFTDLPVFADAFNLHGDYFPNIFTGTIGSARNHETHWQMSVSFFDYVFEGTRPDLLVGPLPQYPDVFVKAHAEPTQSK